MEGGGASAFDTAALGPPEGPPEMDGAAVGATSAPALAAAPATAAPAASPASGPRSAPPSTVPAAAGGPRQCPVDYETVFTNAKAGMDDVDRDRVRRIVFEASKDGAHFKNEQRKEAAVDARIAALQASAAALPPVLLAASCRAADAAAAELEAGRDLSRIWVHLDMDAFYAAVETLADPSLRGRPMAVGGTSMIATANYEARRFGVRSAMPGFIALKLCPELLLVRPDFSKYTAAAARVRAVLARYDPRFLSHSLDEAALDLTAAAAAPGAPPVEQLVARLRSEVTEATGGLTCSAGIAPNRMLAKVCSDINKPNGQYALPPDAARVRAFVETLPIRKIGGIGRVTERLLGALGVRTCGELHAARGLLRALFSPASAAFFLQAGLGLGAVAPPTDAPPGSVGRRGLSHERTLAAQGVSAPVALETILADLAEAVARDMAAEGLRAKTLTLKLKTTDFELRTRALTLPDYLPAEAAKLLAPALLLLRRELPLRLRLVGLRASGFFEPPAPERGQRTLAGFLRPAAAAEAAEGGAEADGAGSSGTARQDGDSDEEAENDLLATEPRALEQGAPDAAACGPSGGAAGADPGEIAVAEDEADEAALHASLAHESSQPARNAAAEGPPRGREEARGDAESSEGGPEVEEAEELAGPATSGRPPAPAPWACAACTFDNGPAARACECCGTVRSIIAAAPRLPPAQLAALAAYQARGRGTPQAAAAGHGAKGKRGRGAGSAGPVGSAAGGGAKAARVGPMDALLTRPPRPAAS